MTASNQLTTLANVKAWAGVTTSSDDTLLNRLIASASRFILSYLQRPTLFEYVFTDVYDGVGQRQQILRHWPVLSIATLLIGNQTIPAAPSPFTGYGCGYVLDPWDGFPPGRPQALSLRGHEFWRGYSNVEVTYTAGFVVQNEAQTVPTTPYQVTVNAPNGNWAVDQGVTYANGTPLTPVASAPSVGQYIAPTSTNAFYQFAAADANASVLISYSYIPADIEQACIEMVSERYKYKDRIGQVSKSLGGQETVSFSQKNMPDFITTLLQPYRRVILV
ncbi:MAG TPA: phage head-tail connector protein [Bryobacteraceae bacterium]|nr:phage head-tail connector protein [Bryobacteraceae bacterium]